MHTLRRADLVRICPTLGPAVTKPLPSVNFICPTGIEVHTEPDPVHINWKPTKITNANNNGGRLFTEARPGKVAVDITLVTT